MAVFTVKVNAIGLLEYAQAGKEAIKDIKEAVTSVLNVGRAEARSQIASEFGVRTGMLRMQSGKMRPQVVVKNYLIGGRVKPLPNLMNIYEGGAHLHNGGYLHPRPVVRPGAEAMERIAEERLDAVVAKIGK